MVLSKSQIRQSNLIKDIMDSYWNHKDSSVLREGNFFDHFSILSPIRNELSINNIEFVDNIWRSWRDSFPDLNIEFKDIEFYNNVIIVDWTGEGTQHGEFQNLEPTGKSVFYPGKTMWTFNNGMITNYMCQIDLMNIYKQLGYFLVQEEYPQQETIRKNKNILVGRLSSVRLYKKYYLTPREVEVLSLWLLGLQAKKIAACLDISYRTVQTNIANISYKCDCICKSQLRDYIISKNLLHMFIDLSSLILDQKND